MPQSENNNCGARKWSQWSPQAKIAAIAGAMILIPSLLALFAGITMWLWNWLMPQIFKLPAIGFWQAVGILLLAQILFKGGHIRRTGSSSWKRSRIRARMREETPEPNAH
ncbi:MAG TPA: hypothetical protein VGI16_04730 [Candidatus Acidoferrum sp.]|jgi:hypothetical protein